MATSSACPVGSSAVRVRLRASATSRPPMTTTAPTGTSSSTAAARACSSALCIQRASPARAGPNSHFTVGILSDGVAALVGGPGDGHLPETEAAENRRDTADEYAVALAQENRQVLRIGGLEEPLAAALVVALERALPVETGNDDVAVLDLVLGDGLDQEHVPGPDPRRRHSLAVDGQQERAGFARQPAVHPQGVRGRDGLGEARQTTV